ncbi:low molecular weight protein-tyrosine-phosphatase [Sanguibacter sp. A247]|uniref:low molecular weight protein-tyrosine-phosphatase n=1 Tax=unclassified Sanguibacter TaxID=2645534 RepID=UPI003FD8A1B4
MTRTSRTNPTRHRTPSDTTATTKEDHMLRIMTVCTGNICRSPMAQIVLQHRLDAAGLGAHVTVDSTGISDEEHGRPLDRRARTALVTRGYAVPAHAARRVRADELPRYDLVLAMTQHHARVLRSMLPTGDERVVMYRAFDPAAPALTDGHESPLDVADPWYGGPDDFETCLDEIEAAADGVVAHARTLLTRRT